MYYFKFFKRHLWNKIILVDSSINDVYAFSPIYIFHHFLSQFSSFTWIMDVPGVLKQDAVDWFPFSTASILIQNRVKIFMELYFRSCTFTVSRDIFQCIILIKMSNKGVFRNMYGFYCASRKCYENMNFRIPAQTALPSELRSQCN